MNRGYELTDLAVEDIDQITEYVAQRFGLQAALDLEANLANAFTLLAEHPTIGHLNEDVAPLPYRIWPVGPSVIIYRSDCDPIRILRVGRPGDWLRGVKG